MGHQKTHKKDSDKKMNDLGSEKLNQVKSVKKKVKYNHKNHWLEEDMNDFVPQRIKKKKKIN